MQVTSTPPMPGLSPARSAHVTVGPKPAAQTGNPATGDLTVRSFERALVEAAGLSTKQAAKVHVVLSVDEGANRVIAKMYNKDSGELIHQMPTDQMLRNAALIREMLGAAVDAVA